MSLRTRLLRLEDKLLTHNDFCSHCMMLQLRYANDPPLPEECSICGRGPGEYGGVIREIVLNIPRDEEPALSNL
jgi:hypothetical protein